MDSFFSRLEWLAQGRKLTPWLTDLGWNKADVTRVASGHIPGPSKLEALALFEGVSLSWLLCAVGTPYLIEYIPDSQAQSERLQQLCDFLGGRAGVHFMETAYGPLAVIYWLAEDPNERLRWRTVVLHGDIERMVAHGHNHEWATVSVQPEGSVPDQVAFLLSRGFAGTEALLGPRGVIVGAVRDLAPQEVRESRAVYLVKSDPAANGERALMLPEWNRLAHELSPSDLGMFISLGKRLVSR